MICLSVYLFGGYMDRCVKKWSHWKQNCRQIKCWRESMATWLPCKNLNKIWSKSVKSWLYYCIHLCFFDNHGNDILLLCPIYSNVILQHNTSPCRSTTVGPIQNGHLQHTYNLQMDRMRHGWKKQFWASQWAQILRAGCQSFQPNLLPFSV